MREVIAVHVGDVVIAASGRNGENHVIPIGRGGASDMPLALDQEPGAGWVVGESAIEAWHERGQSALDWQDVATIGVLVTAVVGEALARAAPPSARQPQVLVVTIPTSVTGSASAAVHEHLTRRYPQYLIQLVPAVVAAAESLAAAGSLAVGASILVVCLSDGSPDAGIVTRTPSGCQVVSGPFAGLPDLARLALGEGSELFPVLLLGQMTAASTAAEAVLRQVAPGRILRADNETIVLGAALWATAQQNAADNLPIDPPEQSEVPVVIDDDVQFTVYRPRSVRPERWEKLLAFAHLTNETQDEDGYPFDPVEQVRREAAAVLGGRADDFVAMARDSDIGLPRNSSLRFVPDVPGIRFEPAVREFHWLQAVHREEFSFRAPHQLDGRTARGRLSVYLGSLIIADISLAIRIDSGAPDARQERQLTNRYRKVFPSYSHLDAAVVDDVGRIVSAFGDDFMRDVDRLRSGEVWSAQLERYIREADMFQLYWSRNSMKSQFVQKEWTYALALGRPGFIRPVFWEQPRPIAPELNIPPPELDRIHFSFLPPSPPRTSHQTVPGRSPAELGPATATASTSPQPPPPGPPLSAYPIGAPPEPWGHSAPPPERWTYAGQPTGSPQYASNPPAEMVPAAASTARSRRRGVRAAIAASVAVVAAFAVAGVVRGTTDGRPNAGAGIVVPTASATFSTQPEPTSIEASPTPTDSSALPGGAPAVVASEQVVQLYLLDLNSRNGPGALSLICASSQADFQREFLAPDGYFAYTWEQTTLPEVSQTSTRLILTYQIVLSNGVARDSRAVVFSLIEEVGPKICGQIVR